MLQGKYSSGYSKNSLERIPIKTTAIINAKCIVENEIVEDHILLFDDKIIGIVEDVMLSDSDNMEIIDAGGAYVSPGFIDIHIHGSGGADVMDATKESLDVLSTTLLQTGTTSFLATTMTMSTEEIHSALHNIQTYKDQVSGAQVLGVHLEGPFINKAKHGAQNEAYVQSPNMELIEGYMDEIKMITLAPEEEESEVFIKHLSKEYPHIILSIGHSDASYEKSKESFAWGVSHATHLFNAMNPYHHREPGIVGAVFDSDVSCDIIVDLVHTHPSILQNVYQMKKKKLMLITDAMRAGCMRCGTYDLGGQSVEVRDGKAVLEDGTLAGSVLKMNEALANMKKHTTMSLGEVIASATQIPAKKLGINKGILRKGYDADMVIFDEDFSIITTIVGGEVKYKR